MRNDDIPIMARLIRHVSGDHLGFWQQEIEKLQNLKLNRHYQGGTESEIAVDKAAATLKLCSGQIKDVAEFSLSDQVRIFAQAAGMIAERGDIATAKYYLTHSLDLASRDLPKQDLANRDLAITGNNLACTLEEKPHRTEAEIELMILAAKTGRKYWELAGGPSEVASAEYRLSQS